ncbi:MAG TPA: hypothetical protein VN734_17085 [Acidobacteriaceae bacterium]|nr:hypothetical protein [Acidobacteriaceae bacterium]
MASPSLLARLDAQYARFRGSWWFVGIFLAYTGIWFVLRHVYHIDPNLDELNTQYSIEATLAGAMISMELNKAEQARRVAAKRHEELLQYIADVAEAILEATGVDSEDTE